MQRGPANRASLRRLGARPLVSSGTRAAGLGMAEELSALRDVDLMSLSRFSHPRTGQRDTKDQGRRARRR
ncbi:hypothetical protein LZ30DRAFT_698382 [Colletotrichum cereale]|nr:hypothetical protein LZ30DRAFT_698382 [Colletotrichum cereale]